MFWWHIFCSKWPSKLNQRANFQITDLNVVIYTNIAVRNGTQSEQRQHANTWSRLELNQGQFLLIYLVSFDNWHYWAFRPYFLLSHTLYITESGYFLSKTGIYCYVVLSSILIVEKHTCLYDGFSYADYDKIVGKALNMNVTGAFWKGKYMNIIFPRCNDRQNLILQ